MSGGRRLGAALLAPAMVASLVSANERPVSRNPAQNFVLHCQGCHGVDGEGVAHRVPSLHDSVGSLVRLASGRDFLLRVPGSANSALPDEALADVINWVVTRYGGQPLPADRHRFTAAEVEAARRRPLLGVHRARREIAAELVASGIEPPSDY